MKRRTAPHFGFNHLAGLLVATTAGLSPLVDLAAATEDERDQHFSTVVQAIDKELHLVAERALAAYGKVNYPDPGGYYKDGLRLHYCSTFSVALTGEVAEALSKEADGLRQRLQAAGDKLPSLVRGYADDSGKVRKLAYRVLNKFNPDLPPPNIPWQADKVAEMEQRAKHLMQVADEALKVAFAEVEKYDKEKLFADGSPTEGPEYEKLVQGAILKRYAFTSTYQLVLLPLREMSYRGDKYNITPEFIKGTVDAWIIKQAATYGKELEQWEWEYGYMYLWLRHTIASLQAETVRQKLHNGDAFAAAGAKLNTSYDGVLGVFLDAVDTDTSQFPKGFQEQIDTYKLEIWRDLLSWHLQLGTPEAANKGIELWKDLKTRCENSSDWTLDSPKKKKAQLLGSAMIYAARLYKAVGETSQFNALLADVQNPKYKNAYAANAKKFMTADSIGGGSSWEGQPKPLDPSRAITVAMAFIGESRKTTDEKLKEKFFTDAAATLRDGVLGLPSDPSDPDFVELAPSLYQLYAYALAKRGWSYRAAIAALEGLSRFSPDEWQEGMHPKWTAKSSKTLTGAGDKVRTLANDAMIYTQGLTSKAGGAVAKATLDAAIKFMKAYDPENVETNVEFLQIIILMQEGEYEEAKKTATMLGKSLGQKKDRVGSLKALRFATDAQYQIWLAELEQDKPDEKKLKAAREELDKLASVLDKFTSSVSEEQLKEMQDADAKVFRSGQLSVITVRIGVFFKAGEYDKVLELLTPDFFAKSPRDQKLHKKLLTYLCGSVYELNKLASTEMTDGYKALGKIRQADEKKAANLALLNQTMTTLLANWKGYRQAKRLFNAQLKKYPALGPESVNLRKQLAQVFNVSERQAKFVSGNLSQHLGNQAVAKGSLEAWLAGKALADVDPDMADELADGKSGFAADKAILDFIEQTSQGAFGDIYYPLIAEGGTKSKPDVIYKTAESLWSVDKNRAIELYEAYLAHLQEDPALAKYLADEEGAIRAAAAACAPTNALKKWWEPASSNKGSIHDLLIDAPNFNKEHYTNTQSRQKDWPEEKRNFAAAYNKLKEYKAEVERIKVQLGPKYEAVMKSLDDFMSVVVGLALQVKVKTRLIDGYMEIGESAKAVGMAQDLFEYDPLDPVFGKAVVDGVLEAIVDGSAPQDAIKEAQKIAAGLRNDSKDPHDYWIFSLQVHQLSLALGEAERVNKALGQYARSNRNPAEELMKPVSEGFVEGRLGSGEGVVKKMHEGELKIYGRLTRAQINTVKRYLRLYDFDGSQHKPFIKMEEATVADVNDPGVEKKVFIITRADAGKEN